VVTTATAARHFGVRSKIPSAEKVLSLSVEFGPAFAFDYARHGSTASLLAIENFGHSAAKRASKQVAGVQFRSVSGLYVINIT